jgi:biopolymer transport protein ExbB/TolQ
MGNILINFMSEGGFVMWIILGFSIVSFGIAIERFFFIFFRYNINGPAFMKKITKFAEARNFARAIQLCNAAPNAALSRVLKAGLSKAGKDEREIQDAVDEVALEILPKLQKRTNYLQTISNVATLMGLLGTILGIIMSFDAVASVEPAMKQKALTQGISVALYTTAFGLFVAIPSLLFYSILENYTAKIIDEIDEFSVKLINLLVGIRKEDAAKGGSK